jgi:hypothetical protein
MPASTALRSLLRLPRNCREQALTLIDPKRSLLPLKLSMSAIEMLRQQPF